MTNPYHDLEALDDTAHPVPSETQHNATPNQPHPATTTPTFRFQNPLNYHSNADYNYTQSEQPARYTNLRINNLRHADNIARQFEQDSNTPDPTTSASYSPSTAPDQPTASNHRGKRRRIRNIPPAFTAKQTSPLLQQPSQGYVYQLNRPDMPATQPAWSTINPSTGQINGTHSIIRMKHSNNPYHPMNHPLAATFGTTRIIQSTEDADDDYEATASPATASPATPDQPQSDCLSEFMSAKSSSAFEANPITLSHTGIHTAQPDHPDHRHTPTVFPTEHSDTSSAYGTCRESISSASLYVPNKIDNLNIHADVRANFISDVGRLHDAHATTDFQTRNADWLAADVSSGGIQTITMNIGRNNVVNMTVRSENRTRLLNSRGEYADGNDHGQIAARYRRGYLELMNSVETEMEHASAAYAKWKAMDPALRVSVLEEMRRPVVQFNGTWVPADRDTKSIPLPLIYKYNKPDRNARTQRARQQYPGPTPASINTTSTPHSSDISHYTQDSRPAVVGVIGDCDSDCLFASSISDTYPTAYPDTSLAYVSSTEDTIRRVHSFAQSDFNATVSARNLLTDRRRHTRMTGNPHIPPLSAHTPHRRPQQFPPRHSPIAAPTSRRSTFDRSSAGTGSVHAHSSVSQRPSSHSTIRNIRTSGHTDSANISTTPRVSQTIDTIADLMTFDHSPELQLPEDITGCSNIPIDGDTQQLYDYASRSTHLRGRVVVVRLHHPVEFTPGIITSRVFGGNVQEFQLHPDRRTAVVIFLHPNEARSLVHHYTNVNNHGTDQDRRELQMDVSWYRGKETLSLIPAQPGLLRCHLAMNASRAIKIHHIPISKTHKLVSEELGNHLQRMIVTIILSKPDMPHRYEIDGQTCIIEFASLIDALEVYQAFLTDQVYDYRNSSPQFVPEKTSRPMQPKPYCGCLNCNEARNRDANRIQRKHQSRQAQYDRASAKASTKNRSSALITNNAASGSSLSSLSSRAPPPPPPQSATSSAQQTSPAASGHYSDGDGSEWQGCLSD